MSLHYQPEEDIVWGNPVIGDTDIPIQSLLTYLNQGLSIDEFLEDFPSVTREEAVAKLKSVRGD